MSHTSYLTPCILSQVGFGLCKDKVCSLQVSLAVCGDDRVDLSVYGHYTDITHTQAMDELDADLPEWSKGAEWAHYVSHLVNLQV